MKKRWGSVILTLLTVLSFSSCSHHQIVGDQTSEVDVEHEPISYDFIRDQDGTCRLVLDDHYESLDLYRDLNEIDGVWFPSLREMVDAVREKRLTNLQLGALFGNSQTIQIPDIETCKEPNLPKDWKTEDVGLKNDCVEFGLLNGESFGAAMMFSDADAFEKCRSVYLNDLSENPNVEINNQKTDEDGKTIIEYQTGVGRFQEIRYNCSKDGTTWEVKETYCVESYDETYSRSPDSPLWVYISCRGEEWSMFVMLLHLETAPSTEEILQFSI